MLTDLCRDCNSGFAILVKKIPKVEDGFDRDPNLAIETIRVRNYHPDDSYIRNNVSGSQVGLFKRERSCFYRSKKTAIALSRLTRGDTTDSPRRFTNSAAVAAPQLPIGYSRR